MSEKVKYAEGEAYIVVKGRQTRYGNPAPWELIITNVLKKKPAVDYDEVALLLKLKLPVALFEKPLLSAAVRVDGDVPQIELAADTVTEIQNLIRSAVGLDVEVRVIPPSER